MKVNYHYKYAAYTDNLNYGRMLIAHGNNRSEVENYARLANKGCFFIQRERVANA